MTDSYATGMALVLWFLFVILGFISMLEFICDLNHWPTISNRVAAWSVANHWIACAALAVLFILLAHFVLNPIYKTPAP